MVIFGNKLQNVPIIGLSGGAQIGLAERPVIDWTSLKIVGFVCNNGTNRQHLLLIQDIREYTPEVILVNSEDALIESDEVIRLRPMLEANFRLIGAKVKTEGGTKLGQVNDYTFDPKTFEIQQLHLRRSMLRGFMTGGLIIHRRQIVEVTPPVIIVHENDIKEQAGAALPVS